MASFEPDRRIVRQLARLEPRPWSGMVWRHTLGTNPPDRTNTRGARWNPPGVEALYASLDRATVVAEGDHLLAVQPIAPNVRRVVHRLAVELSALVDLSDRELLAALGVDHDALTGDDHARCRAVGGAASFLELDGLIVPSARSAGLNLVILFERRDMTPRIRVVESVPLA